MKTLKTIKYTLIITILILLTTSCTDLTDELVPENKTDNTELIYVRSFTGGGDGTGNDNGSKGD